MSEPPHDQRPAGDLGNPSQEPYAAVVDTTASPVELAIIVPTFNEGPNIAELVRRTAAAVEGLCVEMLFVDDSTDDTPDVIAEVARTAPFPVRLLHRSTPEGGLGGAVVLGMRSTDAPWRLVMDGDLQHPPEMIPVLAEAALAGDVDVVVASRYLAGGDAGGLSGWLRRMVSLGSTAVTRAMFPRRLHHTTDPMTGLFIVRGDAIDLDKLRPQGFKILLEILARHDLTVAEEPFVFGERHAGRSKASLRQGARFMRQLMQLRLGRMTPFAAIGAMGAVANLAIMAGLTSIGMPYLWAAVVAAEVTIVSNFVLQDRLVFHDLRDGKNTAWRRFAQSFAFNNAEAVLRIPMIWVIVQATNMSSVLAAAITLVIAFVVRFTFHSRVVYAPQPNEAPAPSVGLVTGADGADGRATRPQRP